MPETLPQKGLILVCGASGQLGSRVARQLLEAGASVRLLLRPHADATSYNGWARRSCRVPRPILAAGSRILKSLKPELATVMGLSLMMDDGTQVDDRPLRRLGIEPRSASEYITQTVTRVA